MKISLKLLLLTVTLLAVLSAWIRAKRDYAAFRKEMQEDAKGIYDTSNHNIPS